MIRKVVKKDFPDCLRLFQELWPNVSINSSDIQSVLEQYLKNENYEIYCYEKDGVIGIVTITKRLTFFYGGKVAIIEDLVIEEKIRNKGIGKRLVDFVEQRMKQEGIRGIELSSDFHRNQTHRFWERMGYKKLAYQFRKNLIHD